MKDVLEGTVGQFWPQLDSQAPTLDGEPLSGVAQQMPDGVFQLKGIVNSPTDSLFLPDADARPNVDYFLGRTEHGGLLLDGVIQSGSSVTIGGSKASTSRHDVEHVVKGLNFERLNGRQFRGASSFYDGIAEWAGLKSITSDIEQNDRGLPHAITLRVEAADPGRVELDNGQVLELGATWTVDGPDDARVVRTPTVITTRSADGAKLDELLQPHAKIQDLFSLAHQGFVRARGGKAIIADEPSFGLKGDLWSRHLMSDRPSVRVPKSMTEFPLFYLSDIGGVVGLKAWVELCDQHPRLVRPILAPFHTGRIFAEQVLIETGAAIDYWRGVNARTKEWARESFQPLAVALSLGEAFETWISDAGQWAKIFWENYNGLKHFIPTYSFDAESVHVLALSGLTVVTCIALQEAAGEGSEICARILNGHRWDIRGQAIRRLVLDSIP